MNRLDRIDQRPFDRLLDPPRCIGGEARPLGGIESLDRPNQADIAFLDEIAQGKAAVHIVLADGNDQPKIGPDHPVLGGGVVLIDDSPTKFALLQGIQQGNLVDLPQVKLQIGLQGETNHADPLSAERENRESARRRCRRTTRHATNPFAIRSERGTGCSRIQRLPRHPRVTSNRTLGPTRNATRGPRSVGRMRRRIEVVGGSD